MARDHINTELEVGDIVSIRCRITAKGTFNYIDFEPLSPPTTLTGKPVAVVLPKSLVPPIITIDAAYVLKEES